MILYMKESKEVVEKQRNDQNKNWSPKKIFDDRDGVSMSQAA